MQPTNTPEEWRPVVGYEGLYEVSSIGNVRSCDREVKRGTGMMRVPGQDKALVDDASGYKAIVLSLEGRPSRFLVHRLVLEAFVGPCPDGMETLHGPGGSSDNRLSNLRWGTKLENALDKTLAGTHNNTKKTHCVNGHPFDLINTRFSRKQRVCISCERRAKVCESCGQEVARSNMARHRRVHHPDLAAHVLGQEAKR